ncbi:lipase 3-like isoform X2 [Dermacentor albipictus]|uniref:lipase 3-like isoform X2 n=1 Tax=Dermacentor albipictus TaxID=60249 RepID=UPI0038FD29CC
MHANGTMPVASGDRARDNKSAQTPITIDALQLRSDHVTDAVTTTLSGTRQHINPTHDPIRFSGLGGTDQTTMLIPALFVVQETLVTRKGYPFERHRVVTEDGYIIEMHRIPWGRMGRPTGWPPKRQPILLMSGLLGDSSNYVLDFPHQSLGFVLADQQYDVWIGNVRGNSYGKGHVNLKVRSKAFWNFSFHEHAVLDLPAQIDYVLRATGWQDVPYVGVSQGTLVLFTMLSERPEYNRKVKAFAGLAPFNKLTHVEIVALTAFTPYAEKYLTSGHEAFLAEVLPRGAFYMPWASKFCALPTRAVCSLIGDIAGDLGSKYMNETRLPVYLHFMPGGTSTKNIVHFAQLVASARPQKFDYGPRRNMLIYGQRVPAEYRLGNVRTDVGIFWSRGDHVITPPNVQELIRELGPHVAMDHFIDDPYYTHAHFLVALNNPDVLFGRLLAFLERYTATDNG